MPSLWQGGGERRERENKTNNTKSSTMPPWEFHPGNYSLTQGTQVNSYLEGERRCLNLKKQTKVQLKSLGIRSRHTLREEKHTPRDTARQDGRMLPPGHKHRHHQPTATEKGGNNKLVGLHTYKKKDMRNAMEDMEVPSVGCVTHTLKLAVHKGLLSQHSIAEAFSNARKIVGHFKHSPQAYSRLEVIQN